MTGTAPFDTQPANTPSANPRAATPLPAAPEAAIDPAPADPTALLPVVSVDRGHHQPLPRRRGTRTWPYLAGVVLVITLAGLAVAYRGEISRRFTVGTRGADAPTTASPVPVVALGRLEPRGEVVAISAPEGAGNARIERLNAAVGDTVAAGAVLAVLDNEPRLLAERNTAAKRVRKAEAVLEQTRISVAASRQELQATLASAKVSRETERMALDRYARLRRSGTISQEELDRAQERLDTADQSVREVEARLQRYEPTAAGEVPEIAVALDDLEVLKGSLQEAEAHLQQATVRAPEAGTVLDIHIHPGEPVSAGTILEMGATEQMFARMDVYETDVGRVRLGQSVTLTSPALAEPLHGSVSLISTLVKRQTVVDATPAANTDARVVEVVVALASASNEAARRFVGLQVRAEFAP